MGKEINAHEAGKSRGTGRRGTAVRVIAASGRADAWDARKTGDRPSQAASRGGWRELDLKREQVSAGREPRGWLTAQRLQPWGHQDWLLAAGWRG